MGGGPACEIAQINVQWNPSITDTTENQHFVPYSEVFLTSGRGPGIFSHMSDVRIERMVGSV